MNRDLRLVCVSDTHGNETKWEEHLPAGDILIHSGDFNIPRRKVDAETFADEVNAIFRDLPFKHKIFVAGNHDYPFDRLRVDQVQSMLPHCTYLCDSATVVEGMRVYGSPWTTSRNMAFSSPSRDHISRTWAAIPTGTDILITHMPPFAVLDLGGYGPDTQDRCEVCNHVHPYRFHWGCAHLLSEVTRRVRPKLHVFGHVHECTGQLRHESGVLFVNAAYDLHQRPQVVTMRVHAAA